jgi:30S ribosomal protein S31
MNWSGIFFRKKNLVISKYSKCLSDPINYCIFAIHLKFLNTLFMGKGDKKTKRGKIVIGSSGVRRARKKRKIIAAVAVKAEPQPKKEIEEIVVPAVKTVPKKSAKKAVKSAEGTEVKPKAVKAKKKVVKSVVEDSQAAPAVEEPTQE